ncbi:hypothetical protein AgCh_023592 [Apium graveolens]
MTLGSYIILTTTITKTVQRKPPTSNHDDTGSTSFTLFNKEAEDLIGAPVDKIIAELPHASSLTDAPPIIKNIVGKRCAFDVKINAYNTQRGYEEYTVYRLSKCTASAPRMKWMIKPQRNRKQPDLVFQLFHLIHKAMNYLMFFTFFTSI